MLSTKQFHVSPVFKTFTAEISDLGGVIFQRLWPDSCDLGFALVSHVSGQESWWVVEQEVTREGDIMMWMLVPTPDTIQRLPALKGWAIKIYND